MLKMVFNLMHEIVGKKLLTEKHTNNFRNLSSLFIDKDNMINGIISNFDQNVKKSRFACDFYRIDSEHDVTRRARTKASLGVVKMVLK